MSTEVHQSLQLSTLPDLVLSQVLSYDDSSFLIINLWKAGDKVLIRKLSRSCERVVLNDASVGSTSRWPKILTELQQLRDLSINRPKGYLMSSISLSFELRKLSPTLERLNLDCLGLYDAFYDLSNFKLPDGSFQPVKILDLNPTDLTLWRFDECWPRLQSFRINSEEIGSFLQPSIVLSLSPCLLTLSYPSTIDQEIMDALPPSLTQLSARQFKNIKIWPPNLINIGIVYLEPLNALDVVSSLPRGLQGTLIGLSRIEFTPQLASTLPPALLAMAISPTTDVKKLITLEFSLWTHFLPQKLTSLSFHGALFLDARLIGALPRTLTILDGLLANWMDISHVAQSGRKNLNDKLKLDFWPPRLQFLSTLGTLPPPSLIFPYITDTLHTLSVTISGRSYSLTEPMPLHLHTFVIKSNSLLKLRIGVPLPSLLTKLTIFGEAEFDHPRILPPSLLSFTIHGNHSDSLQMESSSLNMLPNTLTSLNMRSYADFWKNLPSSLTSFSSHVMDPMPTKEDYASLPMNLIHLKLSFREEQGLLAGNLLAGLPSSLLSLYLRPCSFSTDIFPVLPRSLRKLHTSISSYSIDDLRHIPPHIEHISSFLTARSLSPEIIEALPLRLFITDATLISLFPKMADLAREAAQRFPDQRLCE